MRTWMKQHGISSATQLMGMMGSVGPGTETEGCGER